jgi:hypothetical protein
MRAKERSIDRTTVAKNTEDWDFYKASTVQNVKETICGSQKICHFSPVALSI